MTAIIDEEADGCIFQWKIENISQCWLKTGERLKSPTFIIADAVEGTKWSLSLYPIGEEEENEVGLHLIREEDSSGSDEIDVDFQLAFLDKDGSILKEEFFSEIFQRSDIWGAKVLEEREKIFVSERKTYIPDDTLTVQCTIWDSDGDKPVKPIYLYSRTVFKLYRKNFVWRIDKFSNLKSVKKNKRKDDLIDFDLCLNEETDFEKGIVIIINCFDESINYFSFKISALDSNGKKENCGSHEYFADDLKRGMLSVPLTPFFKNLKNKSQYLPNDVLSLYCEYVISAPTGLYEFISSGILSSNLETETDDSRTNYIEENSLNISFLNDMKSMYNDAILCDTELRTSRHNFPAHRNILSARSPVFRSMFSNDMIEKNSGHVDITDFDDETVQRMLLYMYTDSLEDLDFESASKLYTIADKYEILSLKERCSYFLKANLSPTNACEILVQADLHHDEDLLNAVQKFILEQRREIFCSQQWNQLMNTHLKLAADVMVRKIFQE